MVRVGRYEVERELGRGTMGIVYLAHDPRLGRHVAVKSYELPPGFTAEQRVELKERFLREARAAAVLSHPAIVTVYDADEDPERGTPFIAMEYVPGRSLQDRIERMGRLEPERAFAIAETLAGALDAAHASGIVHRDVKPANILIRDTDGAAKIADFGIARIPGSDLTLSGTSLGTPAYMAPEQVRGHPAEPASDLFSLAVILYECLCGERPFTGEDLATLTDAVVLGTPIPISRRVDSLPPSIDAFFDLALAKNPARRFPTGSAFREALGRVRSGAGSVGAGVGEATVVGFAWNARDARGEGCLPAQDEGESRQGSPPENPDRAYGPGILRSWPAAIAALAAIALIGAGWGLRGGKASNSVLPASTVSSGQARASAPPALDRTERRSASRRSSPRDLARRPSRLPSAPGGLAQTPSEGRAKKAVLKLSVKSRVPAGKLWLTIDQDRVFSRSLAAPAGSKKLVNRLRGREQETFETQIDVSPGRHRIVANVRMASGGLQYEDSALVDLKAGETRTVRIVAGRALGAPLSVKVE